MQAMKDNSKKDWFGEMFSTIGASKSAVSRDFKRLTKDQRALLCAVADVDYYPTLKSYTKADKTRIGIALRYIRQLAGAFRPCVTINDFRRADEVQHD